MKGYTIKSTSNEGVYYLVKDWRKNKALWVKRENLQQEHLFTSLGRARRSLEILLEVMFEYKNDMFVGYVIDGDNEMELALSFTDGQIR